MTSAPPGARIHWRDPLCRALIDGALIAVAVAILAFLTNFWRPLVTTIAGYLAVLLRFLVKSWPADGPAMGLRAVVVSFIGAFLIALIVEAALLFRPDGFRNLRLLRPASDGANFMRSFAWSLMVAATITLALEAAIALYLLGQVTQRPAFAPHRIECEFLAAFAVVVAGRVWLRFQPYSAAKARQFFDWRVSSVWAYKQKWVTFAAIGLVITVSAATVFRNSKNEFIQKINNEWINFKFLGITFDAERILTLEALGFILGLLAALLYSVWTPIMFRRDDGNAREAVRRTIRQVGIGADFIKTLTFYIGVLSRKADWNQYDWTPVNERTAAIGTNNPPDWQAREASIAIALLPPDHDMLRDLGERLYLSVRPFRRFVLCAMFLVAEVLTALPVLLRVLLLFFPRLAESPATWSL